MRRLLSWWRRRQREFDLAVLWPQCVALSPDPEYAGAAFAVHAFNDPAWRKEMRPSEIVAFIERMVQEERTRMAQDE